MPKKGELGQFVDLSGGLGKKEGVMFLRGFGGGGIDTPMYTMCPSSDVSRRVIIVIVKEIKRVYRLGHMRRTILRARLKHWRRAKKSTPCLIKKASRCAADRTSKTTTFFIFHFL